MSKPVIPSRLRFWKPCSGNSGDCHVWRLDTEPSPHFRQRISRGGYIAWRILRSGTLEGLAGWSFHPSAEGSMTTARPPLSLLICPCPSLLPTDYCLNSCCHTLRHSSLTVKTLCLRRGEWDHDPPAVTTRNLTHVQLFNFDFARPIITQIVFHVICNQIQFSLSLIHI